jgi:2-polyprenyl-3-methyl-5-hydroxy-6-metoxy-1,4-benzoquinol methylase
MYIAQRAVDVMRGLFKRYGPSKIKMILWDQEFSGTHWDFIDNTTGDCIYSHLEKHIKNGSILDLGCGPGNTANELAITAYNTYVGVDISEAALAKASKRTEANGRASKNSFVCSDFLDYRPDRQFDVILFRESMYHVPLGKVKLILDYFAKYLKAEGVFIVRMNITDGKGRPKHRLRSAVDIMQAGFDVIEKTQYGESGPTVIVFCPKCPPREKKPSHCHADDSKYGERHA